MRADHLAIATIVIATIGVIGGLAGYAVSDSPATLGFVLECCLNIISALIIIWRYRGGFVAWPAPFLATQREERASVAISFCHLLIAITIGVIAFAHLVAPLRLESSSTVIGLSLPAFVVFAGLAGAKFYVGFNEHLGSLKRDSACSLASALAALGAATGEAAGYETERHHVMKAMRGLWVDALISAAVAVGLAYYGVSSLLESASQGYEWWKTPFWNGAPSFSPLPPPGNISARTPDQELYLHTCSSCSSSLALVSLAILTPLCHQPLCRHAACAPTCRPAPLLTCSLLASSCFLHPFATPLLHPSSPPRLLRPDGSQPARPRRLGATHQPARQPPASVPRDQPAARREPRRLLAA